MKNIDSEFQKFVWWSWQSAPKFPQQLFSLLLYSWTCIQFFILKFQSNKNFNLKCQKYFQVLISLFKKHRKILSYFFFVYQCCSELIAILILIGMLFENWTIIFISLIVAKWFIVIGCLNLIDLYFIGLFFCCWIFGLKIEWEVRESFFLENCSFNLIYYLKIIFNF